LDLLARRGQRLSVVEVASGGTLAAGLHDAQAADRALTATVAAPTAERLAQLLRLPDARKFDGLSLEEQTRRLADGAAAVTGSDWSLAVGPRGAAPGDRPEILAVLRHPDGRLERFRLDGREPLDRSRITTQLLDQLRRRLR
jgi:nicotinamide mononucleotide (NMN) deamidase PncC